MDSPAASAPGVLTYLLGVALSGYSGGRHRFVVDAGAWVVERVQMAGDAWRDAHDFTADVVFGIAFHAGLCGTTEPRGIFSQAVPMRVLAAALEAEAAGAWLIAAAKPTCCLITDTIQAPKPRPRCLDVKARRGPRRLDAKARCLDAIRG